MMVILQKKFHRLAATLIKAIHMAHTRPILVSFFIIIIFLS